MREEDIFGLEPYETFVSFEDCRFQFALARRCRLYRYERLIGINFSVFFDHIDEDAIRSLPFDSISLDPDLDDDIYLMVNIRGLNHSDNMFHALDTAKFSVASKEWATHELRVTSDYIGDDSSFTIEFDYALCRTESVMTGFLKKRRQINIYKNADPNRYKLESEITRSDEPQTRASTQDYSGYDALDELLAKKGIL